MKPMNPLMTARSVAIVRKEPVKVDGRRISLARQLRSVNPVKIALGRILGRGK